LRKHTNCKRQYTNNSNLQMSIFSKKTKEEKKNIEPQKEVVEVKDKKNGANSDAVVGAPTRTSELPKGGDEHAYAIILTPHMTEKSSGMAAQNKYVFKVAGNSSKIEIKKAIEKMYKVKVEKVAVSNKPAKARRVGKYMGEKAGFKKAIITLIEGDKIDIVS